jgi:hypothetical protein
VADIVVGALRLRSPANRRTGPTARTNRLSA